MWIPDWLYERLPTVYGLMALLCLWVAGVSSLTLVSAALLCGAAWITVARRRQARSVSRASARRASQRARR
jgi:hypothetical protein